MESKKQGRPALSTRPYQELFGYVNDKNHIVASLRTLLFDLFRVPRSFEPLLIPALLRQAEGESKKQYRYLSHAMVAVVDKYRSYSPEVPLRGFHLLWVIERGGWHMHQANHALAMMRDLQAWVDGLVSEESGHLVTVHPLSIIASEGVWSTVEEGLLSHPCLYTPITLRRDAWIHHIMVRILECYAEDFPSYVAQHALPVAQSSLLVSDTSELFGLVLLECRHMEPSARITPDFFTQMFVRHGLECWRICLCCRASRNGMNHRLVLYLIHTFGCAWLSGILSALEKKQLDLSMVEAMAAYPKLFLGKPWQEVFPKMLAWRQSGRPIGDVPKVMTHRK